MFYWLLEGDFGEGFLTEHLGAFLSTLNRSPLAEIN
jgi:hypothetical protein